jgi:hypothetical protein
MKDSKINLYFPENLNFHRINFILSIPQSFIDGMNINEMNYVKTRCYSNFDLNRKFPFMNSVPHRDANIYENLNYFEVVVVVAVE